MPARNCLHSLHKKSNNALLNENTPLLPEATLRDFVKNFFARKNEFLAPLNRLQTPLYLFEPEVLRQRARRFQAAFGAHFENTAFFYAVKSNNYSDISRTLLQEGFGLDVSSGLELEMACSLDAPNIIFSGPGKTKAELELAIAESDQVIVLIDSFQELATLGKMAGDLEKQVRIGVRLTTNPQGLWRKFGILPETLPLFIKKASAFKHLYFQGIQFHTSWNLNASAQYDFIKLLAGVLDTLTPKSRNQISFIDIGGGYWPERGEWLQPAGTPTGILRKAMNLKPGRNKNHYCLTALTIEEFAEQLAAAMRRYILPMIPLCRICFEPGRWLCNDAMHLLMTVVDKKNADLVITDAGTNAIGWERFETDYFPVLNLSRPALAEKPCNVLGSLCTPHDVWGYNYWGKDIRIGDILMIPTQGAYTYSLRQNFIKPVPEVAALTTSEKV